MGTIKGQEWVGKKVIFERKVKPGKGKEMIVTEANGWNGIQLKHPMTGSLTEINQYGYNGNFKFEEVELYEQ